MKDKSVAAFAPSSQKQHYRQCLVLPLIRNSSDELVILRKGLLQLQCICIFERTDSDLCPQISFLSPRIHVQPLMHSVLLLFHVHPVYLNQSLPLVNRMVVC